jgi:hypothetical protein
MVRLTALTAALATALVLALPAWSAAPPYIMVSGPRLAKPVLLSDWDENLALLLATDASPRVKKSDLSGLSERPRLDLALFWGWSLDSPPPTKKSVASAHGSFWPAYKGHPAVVRMKTNGEDFPHVASAKVLRIFARHGVPTRF